MVKVEASNTRDFIVFINIYFDLYGIFPRIVSAGVGLYMIISMYRITHGTNKEAMLRKANKIIREHELENLSHQV